MNDHPSDKPDIKPKAPPRPRRKAEAVPVASAAEAAAPKAAAPKPTLKAAAPKTAAVKVGASPLAHTAEASTVPAPGPHSAPAPVRATVVNLTQSGAA